MRRVDAIVVGSGPNGLAAAVTLARAGLTVDVYEGAETPGGGCRTQELTLPGFQHDVCSAVHPLLVASPFFQRNDLSDLGVRLLTPHVAFAHPLDGGRAGAVMGTVEETAAALGADAATYQRLFSRLVRDTDRIVPNFLAPLRSLPSSPVATARFGATALFSARRVSARFSTEEGKALIAGAAAHSMLPLTSPLSGVFARLFTMLAHSVGWPLVQGGSARVVDALVSQLESLDGQVVTGRWITSLDDLPPARATVLDMTPRQLVALAGARLPHRYRRSLERFAYGPGVCKVDWALSGPVPWAAERCREAGTIHVCGTFAEVAQSEAEVNAGRHAERPYCLVTQPSLIDPTRAPAGKHTLWAYCHVPNGSDVDMRERIEAQIERFAPGFRDLILGYATSTATQTEAHNPSYVGGDINAGAATLRQTVFRPTAQWNPYRTGAKGVYLCSASTPPGGGVHGMCGEGAANTVLHDLGRLEGPERLERSVNDVRP
ncbi:MAG TPA: NAD(P)/FAD-dependent oxidoreductase [Acidimicrobiales bacterium]